MDRFRINDDLLRRRVSAREEVAATMARPAGWYWRKFNAGQGVVWNGPMTRGEVLAAFDAWALRTDTFEVARKTTLRTMSVHARVAFCDVPVPAHANTSPATNEVDGLLAYAFPKSIFAGSYVYKEDSWGWSDHAWGTATDRTEHLPDTPCSALFDWLCRMAKSGNMNFDYALGNHGGAVWNCSKQATGGYRIASGGGDNSHLWHVHVSQVDHGGAKPPTVTPAF